MTKSKQKKIKELAQGSYQQEGWDSILDGLGPEKKHLRLATLYNLALLTSSASSCTTIHFPFSTPATVAFWFL